MSNFAAWLSDFWSDIKTGKTRVNEFYYIDQRGQGHLDINRVMNSDNSKVMIANELRRVKKVKERKRA